MVSSVKSELILIVILFLSIAPHESGTRKDISLSATIYIYIYDIGVCTINRCIIVFTELII